MSEAPIHEMSSVFHWLQFCPLSDLRVFKSHFQPLQSSLCGLVQGEDMLGEVLLLNLHHIEGLEQLGVVVG